MDLTRRPPAPCKVLREREKRESKLIDRLINRLTKRPTDSQASKQADRLKDRQTEGPTGREAIKQTE